MLEPCWHQNLEPTHVSAEGQPPDLRGLRRRTTGQGEGHQKTAREYSRVIRPHQQRPHPLNIFPWDPFLGGIFPYKRVGKLRFFPVNVCSLPPGPILRDQSSSGGCPEHLRLRPDPGWILQPHPLARPAIVI